MDDHSILIFFPVSTTVANISLARHFKLRSMLIYAVFETHRKTDVIFMHTFTSFLKEITRL